MDSRSYLETLVSYSNSAQQYLINSSKRWLRVEMAYVNVAEWSPDQVAEWLKGLDDILQPYIHLFVAKNITGNRLLHLSSDDFKLLNITCIGHQEIILQGVELLSNIHYQIDQENVQYIALRLSSKARSIYNELKLIPSSYGQYRVNGEEDKEEKKDPDKNDGMTENKKERVSTNVLSGVSDVLSSVKVLVSWLHRNPFHGIEHYDELKSNFLDLSIRLATIAQRDSFAENPVSIIRECCRKLAEMADSIIQDSKDPLILQPSFLDVVTIKKRADDNWGLGLYSSYHGVHQISMLRALSPVSPAYTCGKLMCGDQVVQVNYQTVVGWTSLKVTQLMQENPVQVILTVKKCPTHVNTVTEIYFKPFRLPSKKRTYSPWINNTISHQQYNLQSIPNLQFIKSFDGRTAAQRIINTEPHPKSLTPPSASLNSSGSDVGAITASESDSEDLASDLDDDAFLSDIDYGRSGTPSGRLFQPKPRPHVQRRATIPGASARHTLPFDQLLEGYCHRPLVPSPIGDSLSNDAYQYVFRNNKDSLDARITRPHTCIGTEKKKSGKGGHHWKRPDDGEMPFIDESDEKEEGDWKDSSLSSKGSQNSMKNTLSPILSQTDKENADKDSQKVPTNASTPKFEMKNEHKILDDRPKLDKSYSSPTYDLDDREASVFTDKTTALNPSRSKGILTLEILNEKSESENISNTEEKTVKAEEKNVIKYSENILDESKEISTTAEETFVPSRAEVYSVAANEVKEPCLKPSPPSVTHSQSSYLSQESYHETKGNECTYSFGAGISSVSNSSPVTCEISNNIQLHVNKNLCSVWNFSDNSTDISANLLRYIGMNRAFSYTLKTIKSFVNSHDDLKNIYNQKSLNSDLNISVHGNVLNRKMASSSSKGSTRININGSNDGDSFRVCGGGVGCGGGVIVSHCKRNDEFIQKNECGANSSVGSADVSKVVLRETKSRSPSAWRKGIILDNNGGSRRISCRDLGLGDHHGWLYRRKDSKGFLLSHRWEKRWFILKKNSLYGYRDKDSLKADSLIYLPGFHVCPAPEVKSKRFTFKIYHSSGATFYFACDTTEERSRWMSQMGMSAISSVSPRPSQERESTSCSPEEAYYSETDDELEKSPSSGRSTLSPSSRISPTKDGMKMNSSSAISLTTPSALKSSSSSSRIASLSSLASLGSGKQGLKFLQSSRGALNNPVPTHNFRSYMRKNKNVSTEIKESSALQSVCSSKSETSLLEPSGGIDRLSKRDRISSKFHTQVPSYMRPTQAFTLHTDPDNSVTNLSKNGRRGSIGGLSISSSSLRSLSPRRGSLDCLVSKGISPPVSPQKSITGSTGSVSAQDEYREGSPEKLWISSLRSNSRSPIPQNFSKDRDGERLKRTLQYQPIQRSKGDSLQMAFELSLSSSPKKTLPTSTFKENDMQFICTPNRPQVPPRTKFLSPSERVVTSPPSPRVTPPASNLKSKAPPNLTLPSPQEDAESPKTPLKPTMGVSMIGKQRRTPGALSPREILPEYPGLEYPPTFEPESYTLNPTSENAFVSPPQPPPKQGFRRTLSPVSEIPATNIPRKSAGRSPGYVNISHVSNAREELNVKSYHHNIYVTSPYRYPLHEMGGKTGGKQPPPIPPDKPSKVSMLSQSQRLPSRSDANYGSSTSDLASTVVPGSPARGGINEYVAMGSSGNNISSNRTKTPNIHKDRDSPGNADPKQSKGK
ncbi:Connector enhancer of kinase suppressor of ras 2 [Armadillidium vulgare]|nr:Connector enhancer of kinase suppressor of ras 2 [Armadillidium vulgare]